jgi:hypothetical protein
MFLPPFFQAMPESITYYAISAAELDRIVRDTAHSDMVTAETAAKRFDCSANFIKKIAKEHGVKALSVPGHGKVVLYELDQLRKLFKPIQ